MKPLSKYISHTKYVNICMAHLHIFLIYHPFQSVAHKQPVAKSQKEDVSTSIETDAQNLQPGVFLPLKPDVENQQPEELSYSRPQQQQDAQKTTMLAKDHELGSEVHILPEVLLKEEDVCIFNNNQFHLLS